MRFAHLKTHHRFERLRLRGLSGARDEFHLAAIVQNLKTMALRLLRPPSRCLRARELRQFGERKETGPARAVKAVNESSSVPASGARSPRRLFRQHRPVSAQPWLRRGLGISGLAHGQIVEA